jgi:hypothetical protein
MISVSLENSRQCALNERTEAPVKLTTVCFGCHQTFDGKRMDEQHGERSTSGGTSSAHGDGDEIVQRQAGRVHDATSLAASNDENLPTGSKAACSIWFGLPVECLAKILECSFDIHDRRLDRGKLPF